MELPAGSQRSSITISREDRYVTPKCLHEQFDNVCRSMDSQLGAMAAATLEAASQTGASSKNQDGHIRVWWYRGESTLAACIRHRRTDPSPIVMIWGAIRYTSRSPLVHIEGILNSARYISDVLPPVAVPFLQTL
ncbi:uncharacterized protein TNCV_4380111 [Trichonephila clavipes]|nr:uncharacterized protein TNCV_4380111 [Trichonephila clavipes]